MTAEAPPCVDTEPWPSSVVTAEAPLACVVTEPWECLVLGVSGCLMRTDTRVDSLPMGSRLGRFWEPAT